MGVHLNSASPFIKMIDISRALAIKGWMSQQELTWLAETAAKCQYMIEVGAYRGRTTRALADNTNGTVVVVDPYSGVYYNDDGSIMTSFGDADLEHFNENLADHLATHKVVHFRTTLIACPIITCDLVFIDGDHRRIPVEDDIFQALRRLRPKGILAGHDYGAKEWPGVKQAVDGIIGPVETVGTIWFKDYGK